MPNGTAQRNSANGALKRHKAYGGIRRNAYSTAKCCCGTAGTTHCACRNGSGYGNFNDRITCTLAGINPMCVGACLIPTYFLTAFAVNGTYCLQYDPSASTTPDGVRVQGCVYTGFFTSPTILAGTYYRYFAAYDDPPATGNCSGGTPVALSGIYIFAALNSGLPGLYVAVFAWPSSGNYDDARTNTPVVSCQDDGTGLLCGASKTMTTNQGPGPGCPTALASSLGYGGTITLSDVSC